MMKMLVGALVAAACLATAAGAGAPTPLGIGALPCALWNSDEQDNVDLGLYDLHAQEAWLSGFLSGYGASSADREAVVSGIDPDSAVEWVRNYCRDHPADKAIDAATAFVTDLGRRAASH
jgi:hypothetical protein